jgi:hypothetical protein
VAAVLYVALTYIPDLAGVTVPSQVRTAVHVLIGWFGVGWPLLMLAKAYRRGSIYVREEPRWQVARERWDRLFYCARDDSCFLAGESEHASPPFVSDLLFDPPARRRPPTEQPGVIEATV